MIRKALAMDQEQILALYCVVAAVPGGLARSVDELSAGHVAGFMARAAHNGIEFVWEENGRILGEIHACGQGIAGFAHLLNDLTIAVAPHGQGRGISRALFAALLDEVVQQRPDITRVELCVRESNTRARHLYRALGFVEEGRLRERVVDQYGLLEADIFMGWLRDQAIMPA